MNGIRVASNVPYKGRKGIRITMKDGTEYLIGIKEAEELGHLLLASTGKVALDVIDFARVIDFTKRGIGHG